MIKSIESAELVEELSTRFSKIVINTHTLMRGMQLIRISEKANSTYLLYKDVVDAEDSFWFGYKVVNEQTLEIDITKPLWLHINATITKKKIVINDVKEIPFTDLLSVKAYKDIPIDYASERKNLELTQRCIFSITNNISELYVKSRIHSYLKVLAAFARIEYDFNKSEVYSSDEEQLANGAICLKSRYMPVMLMVGQDKIPSISTFLDNLKLGKINLGVWYCSPLKNGHIDTSNGFFAIAQAAKPLNVNSILSDEYGVEVYKYDVFSDLVEGDKSDLYSKIQVWLSDYLKALNLKVLDTDAEVTQILGKIEKHKDLFTNEVIKNIYFTNLENENKTQILTIREDLLDISVNQPVLENANVEAIVFNDEQSIQQSDVLDEKVMAYKPTSLLEEFLEGFDFNIQGDLITFTAVDKTYSIEFSKKEAIKNPNRIFNETLELRIDPFTVAQMFEQIGVTFKKYTYSEARSLIAQVSDEDLSKYKGFENYLSLVRLEIAKRTKSKLMCG